MRVFVPIEDEWPALPDGAQLPLVPYRPGLPLAAPSSNTGSAEARPATGSQGSGASADARAEAA